MRTSFKTTFLLCATLLVAAGSTAALAQAVVVKDAWARATVQGQKATGVFMTLTSKRGGTLVSASSPMAGLVEVHEMRMNGDVMQMRPVPGGLKLPAGKTVALKAGGFHMMMLDLKQPLLKGTTVPMTLVFQDAKGVESKTELKVPVALAVQAHAGH